MEVQNELPILPSLMQKFLLRSIRRSLARAKKEGSAFMVVMFTANGEVAMYSESQRFLIVKE